MRDPCAQRQSTNCAQEIYCSYSNSNLRTQRVRMSERGMVERGRENRGKMLQGCCMLQQYSMIGLFALLVVLCLFVCVCIVEYHIFVFDFMLIFALFSCFFPSQLYMCAIYAVKCVFHSVIVSRMHCVPFI